MVRFFAQKGHLTLQLHLFSSSLALSAQPKGFIYEESKVLQYELLDSLIYFDGLKVSDSKDWFNKRRLKILKLFEEKYLDFADKHLK